MTSPSNLSILRVYLPDDLLDQLHALAKTTGQPMRMVVRGVLELGLTKYIGRWTANCAPVYDDELSNRPYQEWSRHERRRIRREAKEGHMAEVPPGWTQPPLIE